MSLAEADAGPGREIQGAHALGRGQGAGVEALAAERDLLAAGTGDLAELGRLREHAVFEEAVSDDPEIDVPAIGTGDVHADPAAGGAGDLGRHDRGLRQAAMLELAATFGEFDARAGAAGRALQGRIGGQDRALHLPRSAAAASGRAPGGYRPAMTRRRSSRQPPAASIS